MNNSIGNYILRKRLFFRPWKFIYCTGFSFDRIFYSEDIKEAKIYKDLTPEQYMRIEDRFMFSNWQLIKI